MTAPARDGAAMTRTMAAEIADAVLTVRLWQQAPPRYRDRIMRHVARALGCYPAWGTIQTAIVRRMLAGETVAAPLRLAA